MDNNNDNINNDNNDNINSDDLIWFLIMLHNAKEHERHMLLHMLTYDGSPYHLRKSSKIENCAICLSGHKGKIAQLQCMHVFHEECLKPTEKGHPSYPVEPKMGMKPLQF